jgi:hypothetical protein
VTVPVLAPRATDRPRSSRWTAGGPLGATPTLDAAIVTLWSRISAHRAAECPLCQGEMRPDYGAGALPVAGRCQDCGTVLS